MTDGQAALVGQVAGSAMQIGAQAKFNKKSRKFQREMFDKTNTYNSPVEQRKRLEAAGLNPNLVYGGSSGGTAGTANQPAEPKHEPLPLGQLGASVSQGIGQISDLKSQQAGIQVNEARADNIKQDTLNKAIESVSKTIKNHSGMLDYKKKERLFETSIKLEQERLNNLGIQSEYTAGKNQREERITNETVSKLQVQIANERKKGRGFDYDNIIKKLDAELAKKKIRPTDPIYYRLQKEILQQLDPDASKIFKRGPIHDYFQKK